MAKGEKTGGRIKGTPNKQSRAVKQCILNAFEDIGGVKNLAMWASDNQTEFYKMWGRLVPHEVDVGGQDDNPVEMSHTIKFVFPDGED